MSIKVQIRKWFQQGAPRTFNEVALQLGLDERKVREALDRMVEEGEFARIRIKGKKHYILHPDIARANGHAVMAQRIEEIINGAEIRRMVPGKIG